MSTTITGKPQLSRMVNRRLILERIRRNGAISRAELAKITAIRAPTVSAVIRELIEDGLVKEIGAGETSGGRAPRMLSLNHNEPIALGFELSETSIHAGLCDLSGTLTSKTKISITPPSPEEAVEKLHSIGARLLKKSQLTWDDLAGVGVAAPGYLDQAKGHIRWSSPFKWRDVPLKRMCEERWKTSTDVVNDSQAGGMACHLYEVDQSVKNLVFLYLRFEDVKLDVIGLGTGIIIHGELYQGEFGSAGEITTPIAHPVATASAAGARFKTVEQFVKALRESDKQAVKATQRLAADLLAPVTSIVNLLGPGVLFIGADIAELRDAIMAPLDDALREHRQKFEVGETQLMASALGEYGVVRGAIAPTLQRLFRMPPLS